MDLEVQADEMSSCPTAAATSFAAGFCWGPLSWGDLESLVSAHVGGRRRGAVGCFLFECLVRLPVDPPVQLITKNNTGIYLFQVLMKKSDTRGHFSSSSW
jgi:hypothetical protein